MARVIASLMLGLTLGYAPPGESDPGKNKPKENKTVRLGNFSVSLAVKDLAVSREFYEKLGFKVVGGNNKNYSIMQNETSTIGLFQGMFDKNCLTYNPGWDRNCNTLPDFDDVRVIQKMLLDRGIKLTTKTDESGKGPAHVTLADPDGNPILIDQHVPKPSN